MEHDRCSSEGHRGYSGQQMIDCRFAQAMQSIAQDIKGPENISLPYQFDIDLCEAMINLGDGNDPYNNIGQDIVQKVIGV